MKNENLPTLNGGIITDTEDIKENSKGEFTISERNKFYYNLVLRGLQLEQIGYNFVIDFKFVDKYDLLSAFNSSGNIEGDNTKYYGLEKELVNILNKINLFLNDRQLGIRHSKKGFTILQVYDTSIKLRQVFIRQKNATCVSKVPCLDPVTKEEYTREVKTRKGMFLFDTSRNDDYGDLSRAFIDSYTKQLKIIDEKFIHGIFNSMQDLTKMKAQKEEKKA